MPRVKEQTEPHVVPHLLDEEGFCPAHRPGGREAMAERGRKGGLTTKRMASQGVLFQNAADHQVLRLPSASRDVDLRRPATFWP